MSVLTPRMENPDVQIGPPLRGQWPTRFVVLLSLLLAGGLLFAGQTAGERTTWHTGRRLEQQLTRPVNFVLHRTTPRTVVQRLRELYQVALLLDRRIDPDRTIDVQFAQMTLDEALRMFALQLEGELVQVGGTLFIGPPQSTDRIRTLIALRSAELLEFEGDGAIGRQFTLLRGRTLRWDDLAEPARLIDDVCRSFDIAVTDEQTVPHDLWGAGMLVDSNAVESLCLLLGQFDRTFVWEERSAAIRIVEAPAEVTIEREHTPGSMSVADALELIGDEFPHRQLTAEGRRITLAATVGEHEQIAELLAPVQRSETAEPTQGPLSRRRFTLKAPRARASVILRTLQAQDVTVEYDAEQLQRAGIDLQQRVSLELDKASAEELFTQLCKPLGLRFEIEGKTVRLTPEQASPRRQPGDASSAGQRDKGTR